MAVNSKSFSPRFLMRSRAFAGTMTTSSVFISQGFSVPISTSSGPDNITQRSPICWKFQFLELSLNLNTVHLFDCKGWYIHPKVIMQLNSACPTMSAAD